MQKHVVATVALIIAVSGSNGGPMNIQGESIKFLYGRLLPAFPRDAAFCSARQAEACPTGTVQQRLNEPNVRRTAFGGREVLIPETGCQPAKSDGTVYVFGKDGLRTMKVEVNNHSDLLDMGRCQATDEIWEFLQRYRVDE